METTRIGGQVLPRIITGLWQLAGGHNAELDRIEAVQVMDQLVRRGLTCFDMADHYGPAEVFVGDYRKTYPNSPITTFTKWCPKPGPTSAQIANDAVDKALTRMEAQRVDLLQYHVWKYEDRFWTSNLHFLQELQTWGKIQNLGLTNTDLAHLKVLHATGIPIVSNQVSVSVIDRRITTGGMAKWCQEHGVAILAYGVLLGGFLSEKWIGKDEPKELQELSNWSLRKYKKFIDCAGGWSAFQKVLGVFHDIAQKHGVPVSTVAIRHTLDTPGVSAVIIGSRLTPDSIKYAETTLQALQLRLDDQDRASIANAQSGLTDIPGDLGDEYRRPPFLTASGNLSDHLDENLNHYAVRKVEKAARQGTRVEYSSGSKWEPYAGYCRAVRIDDTITVSGTTATFLPDERTIGGSSAAAQTTHCFDIINGALTALGGSLRDVVRTRCFLRHASDCLEVAKEHGRIFEREGVRPTNTTMGGLQLIGDSILVEIEADAIVSGRSTSISSIKGDVMRI